MAALLFCASPPGLPVFNRKQVLSRKLGVAVTPLARTTTTFSFLEGPGLA